MGLGDGSELAVMIPPVVCGDPLAPLTPQLRRTFIAAVLDACTPDELLFISRTLAPLLKRDAISALPPELALSILRFVDSPRTLVRIGAVSSRWRALAGSDELWQRMCARWGFDVRSPSHAHFKSSYTKLQRWTHGGRLLRTHRLPVLSSPPDAPSRRQPDSGVVTCLALDASWIVVGLASSRIHVFSATTGVLARTLVGHDSGVWGLCLVSAHGRPRDDLRRKKHKDEDTTTELWRSLPNALKTAVGLDCEDEEGGDEGDHTDTGTHTNKYTPERQSDPCFASEGWGQPNALVVSGGCDKVVRVWDVHCGHCIYVLAGHTSTIRCLRTVHGRALAVTGSRDGTLRTWDIRRGRALRVLVGHVGSVRCLDVNGARAVSGSYDTTCRVRGAAGPRSVWDLDTGECLHVLAGHFHQVYAVAFDGVCVVTGGLDTTIRVWDAESG
ncbi:hypothetical protein C0993_009867 [Termitomyces sp. T159_Od127]|nr:hypothetical protein C0993_009867 [Termitomyces sp. T159_Od127]